MTPSRAAALRVLGDLREGRRTARESIDSLVASQPLSPQDLGLATELVMGVVRHRLTLARVIGAFASHGWKGINHRLQQILMLAVYQILWLDAVPSFAAVNEAVEQAKAEGGGGPARFVNGILRQILREIDARRVPADNFKSIEHEAATQARGSDSEVPIAPVGMRTIPIDLHQSCRFARAVLPDPAQKPTEHLADATSQPTWLVQRWVDAYGIDAARCVCLAGILRPPFVSRPNTLKTTTGELIETLSSEGYSAKASADGCVLGIDGPFSPIRSEAFAAGLFQPQDRTAMDAVSRGMSGLRDGQIVIDLCAGLGTKSTHMAEVMRNDGLVVACEVDEPKLDMIRTNAARLGHTCIETCLTMDAEKRAARLARVDWILVDAPCSNTGVLARRPEARYRLNMRALTELAELQLSILDRAASLARENTRLVYSTCSIDPEENERVVAEFLKSHPGWTLADSLLTLPQPSERAVEWRDGGYWATLARA